MSSKIWYMDSVMNAIGLSNSTVYLQDDPDWTLEKEMAKRRGVPYPSAEQRQKTDDPEFQADEAAGIGVGDRCEVQPGAKRGTVR